MQEIVKRVAEELQLKEYQVNNVVKLLFTEECTIPFVARYRKEMTGSLDEVKLREIRDRTNYLKELEASRQKYLKVVEEHCAKNPELQSQFATLKEKFLKCETKQELEDLYLPFKPKRRTRGQIAREKGLETLLDKILAERANLQELDKLAATFITPADASIDPNLKVNNEKEALAGAGDILAERISETAEYRAIVRSISQETGELVARKAEKTEEESEPPATTKSKGKKNKTHKYENYFDYRESIRTAPSHRVMAVRRGDAEKVLRMSIEVNEERIIKALAESVIDGTPTSPAVESWMNKVVEDSYKRLIGPSIETELRLELKSRAELEAIQVFSENLEKLLLLPPIPGKVVLGIDPGLRTGSKLAVVSETGKFLAAATIFPDYNKEESPKTKDAAKKVINLLKEYNVEYIATGNGTGSKEIERFVANEVKKAGLQGIKRLIVNEAGASVYSTDPIARQEFPDLDPTIRSAISIARRLQDPLAELVKIDPRSIGVGQYQHDVNVTKLKTKLEEVVESCVNKVGVNLNTASHKLLGYVSGIGQVLAKNIVDFRNQNGRFDSRSAVKEVSGFGPKAFEQAAGFLRVPSSPNLLDNSAVHPERYDIVETIAKDLNMPLSDFVGKREIIEAVSWEKYVSDSIGMPTLQDISKELIKPGRDPREDGARLIFSDDINDLEDLKIGMRLKGTVTNVTNFGAFVDIGVHQDGLVHISELSDDFVSDPQTVVAVGDIVDIRVIDVDLERRRISLSRRTTPVTAGNQKDKTPTPTLERKVGKPRNTSNRPRPVGAQQRGERAGGGRSKPRAKQPSYSVNDLLEKFKRR